MRTVSDDAGLAADKEALRERMLVERSALPAPAREEASRAIGHRLDSLAELRDADAVLGYVAFGTEVDLRPYLEARLLRGRAVYLPWVDGDVLRIARVRDLDADLVPGWRGVREPAPGHRQEADVRLLDAVVAPGVAFDRHGHRLGYGGGHFDRLLARLRPGTFVAGVAFDAQVVDTVPVEAHDAPVDAVVTESCIMRAAT